MFHTSGNLPGFQIKFISTCSKPSEAPEATGSNLRGHNFK